MEKTKPYLVADGEMIHYGRTDTEVGVSPAYQRLSTESRHSQDKRGQKQC